MAMKHLAEHAGECALSAKDVAEAYGIPQEALAKILQRLAKARLLTSSMASMAATRWRATPRRFRRSR